MWDTHCEMLIRRANSRLGLTKRTYHFVKNRKQRLVLYQTMVRSIFQHCAEVWRPVTKKVLNKFEGLQKRAVKWIYNEEYSSYPDTMYMEKLSELEILTIEYRFKYSDLKLFFRIINSLTCIKLPYYIDLIDPIEVMPGTCRLRSTHKDPLHFKCNIDNVKPVLRNSFFYRSHVLWNNLPLNLRLILNPSEFDTALKRHLLSELQHSSVLEPD